MAPWTSRAGSWLARHPFLLFLGLYAAIAAATALAALALPETLRQAVAALTGGAGLGGIDRRGAEVATAQATPMWAIGAVAMVSAGVLGLPGNGKSSPWARKRSTKCWPRSRKPAP